MLSDARAQALADVFLVTEAYAALSTLRSRWLSRGGREPSDAHQQAVGLALLDACGAPRARRGDELPTVTEWGCA